MEYWLKENKKFLLAVAATALFVLLYWLVVLGPIRRGAQRATDKLAADRQNFAFLSSAGVPDEHALDQANSDLRAQEQKLDDLVKRTRLVVDEKYLSKDKYSTYREHFEARKLEVRDVLSDLAGADRDTFGFAAPPMENEAAYQDGLLRLGVAEAAVNLAVPAAENGGKIAAVDPFRGMDRPNPADLFVRRVPVEMKVVGTAESLFRILHAFQTKGGYLCVDTLTIGRAATSGQDLFDASIVVCGLVVDPTKPLKLPEASP